MAPNDFSMALSEVMRLQLSTEAFETARRVTKCYPTYQSFTPEQQDIIKEIGNSNTFLDDINNLRCEVSKGGIQAALFCGANKEDLSNLRWTALTKLTGVSTTKNYNSDHLAAYKHLRLWLTIRGMLTSIFDVSTARVTQGYDMSSKLSD